MIVVHALFMMQCSMEIGLSVWIWASEWFFRHICNVVSVRASMATKALSFALSLNDLTNNHFSSNTPHTAAKVSVFTVKCSSSGTLSLSLFCFSFACVIYIIMKVVKRIKVIFFRDVFPLSTNKVMLHV